MKDEYDFSLMKGKQNPYAEKLTQPIPLHLSEDVILYFENMAGETGIPYQSLINLYLRDCVSNQRKINVS